MLLRWLKPLLVSKEMKENLIRFAFVLSIVSLISMAVGWLKPQPLTIFADVAMISIFIYAEVRERIMRNK
jgi:nicotinamide riboside transporter PnuC|nr:MAG TPA: hypothetical protein [Caudoviricetes sp.]